ncbi:cystathionine gamma-lyase [Alphaproteobacteria bacterium]|nr:cystathionine gamma-lyase [Alphaproteobacteria bacterium]
MSTPKTFGLATAAIHGRQHPDPSTGAVIPPIYATSTFVQIEPGKNLGWDYSRAGNPTRDAFEGVIAELEGGRSGFAFASGLAAEAAILDLLEQNSQLVISNDMYGGTWRLLNLVRKQTTGLDVVHADFRDPAAVEAAIGPKTKMIWVETPSNPLMELADLEAIARIAKKHRLLSVADNTFASPAIQRPLDYGFDIVVHSITKYIGGHSDIIGGAVIVKDDPELAERLSFLQKATGGILDPFSSFLALRGVKTLPLRIERHSENAYAIAKWLEGCKKVERVLYPWLESHPQYRLARAQMRSGGGMVSFFLKTDAEGLKRFFSRMKLFALAESLGGVESLVNQPSTMTHASVPEERRLALGITPNLIRLSVGIEDKNDLIAELEDALASL